MTAKCLCQVGNLVHLLHFHWSTLPQCTPMLWVPNRPLWRKMLCGAEDARKSEDAERAAVASMAQAHRAGEAYALALEWMAPESVLLDVLRLGILCCPHVALTLHSAC